MYVDRDIDAVMHRTSQRPLVTGAITPAAALIFAVALEVLSFGLLWTAVNLLSAILAVSATLFYVFVYTLWLKRSSRQNIVIGGAAGAVPVLVGWTAVRGSLTWAPVILFAVIFFWTPPHFWALAIKYRDEYAAAHVPMLPAVASLKATASQILLYTTILWGVSLAFGVEAGMGPVYLLAAFALGAMFMLNAVLLYRQRSAASAMRVFSYSITYVTLLFGAMAVDQLIRHV
jgi:protoheme IX farnesyltransferase